MSKRKSRLIRSDNFFINQYYNKYNSYKPILKTNSKNIYTSLIKKTRYKITNERSLSYSSVYKNLRTISSKNYLFLEIDNYALYLKKFLTKYSDSNLYNLYKTNIKAVSKEKNFFSTNTQKYDLFFSNNPLLYKKQSSFFNFTYKYRIHLPFEKEDQNKLLIRKYNMLKQSNL